MIFYYYHELDFCLSLKKSLVCFTSVSAALFLVIGLILYPAGWGSKTIDELCTRPLIQKPGVFVINDCSLGWAFFVVLGGTLLSFLCSLLSSQAEKSTSSDDVQDQISDGRTVICLI